jgi:CMP-N-acetylneuraminic acid synthetase
MQTEVIGIIAGRGGSIRLPGKNVIRVAGKPLITHVIEAAKRSKLLDRVVVTTDDEEISTVSKSAGAEIIKRPAQLALHNSPIDDSYRHVLTLLEEQENYKPEIIVVMQANIPVRRENEIDEMVSDLISKRWASSIATGRHVVDRPEWMKILKDQQTYEISPFMDPGIKFRKQDLPELYLLDGAVIACRRAAIIQAAGEHRVHAYMGERVIVHVHDPRYSLEIDEPEDLELAEFYLSHQTQI